MEDCALKTHTGACPLQVLSIDWRAQKPLGIVSEKQQRLTYSANWKLCMWFNVDVTRRRKRRSEAFEQLRPLKELKQSGLLLVLAVSLRPPLGCAIADRASDPHSPAAFLEPSIRHLTFHLTRRQGFRQLHSRWCKQLSRFVYIKLKTSSTKKI